MVIEINSLPDPTQVWQLFCSTAGENRQKSCYVVPVGGFTCGQEIPGCSRRGIATYSSTEPQIEASRCCLPVHLTDFTLHRMSWSIPVMPEACLQGGEGSLNIQLPSLLLPFASVRNILSSYHELLIQHLSQRLNSTLPKGKAGPEW